MQANKLLIIITIILFVSTGCSKSSSGFILQNFEVSNPKLETIINIISNDLKKNEYIIVIDFLVKDSVPEFWFSFHKKDELRDYYIFFLNRRIIGYLTKNNSEIILLSRINYKDDFEGLFCKFIYPTEKKKKFDYIYFPDNQYKMYEEKITDDRSVVKVSRWPPEFYEYHDCGYIKFRYINNKFINL